MTEIEFKLYQKKLGDRIKRLRIAKDLSRSQVAHVCGVEERLIADTENGKEDCYLDFLIVLTDCLEVGLSELMGFELD
ncbi:MAG: helix-turn-helix transcriptional regulator [Reichenbachiella sp.]|uniref:helix-turn-helix domain-containing protein n=1 Tax=Reichenbachiella sp. TaxID=2184521 RepID=UPI003263EE77